MTLSGPLSPAHAWSGMTGSLVRRQNWFPERLLRGAPPGGAGARPRRPLVCSVSSLKFQHAFPLTTHALPVPHLYLVW